MAKIQLQWVGCCAVSENQPRGTPTKSFHPKRLVSFLGSFFIFSFLAGWVSGDSSGFVRDHPRAMTTTTTAAAADRYDDDGLT
jgi:hypothetical protein